MSKCITHKAYILSFDDFDSERALFRGSNFFLFVSSRATSTESLRSLIAFTYQNIGTQIRAMTSSKVEPNSSQAAMNMWVSMLQWEFKNSISSSLLLIEMCSPDSEPPEFWSKLFSSKHQDLIIAETPNRQMACCFETSFQTSIRSVALMPSLSSFSRST